jgi:nucleotide-binding universal stress UspA family protein
LDPRRRAAGGQDDSVDSGTQDHRPYVVAAVPEFDRRQDGQALRPVADVKARHEMTTDSSARPLVVVGVDGSAESVAALKWAADYAVATGGHLKAVLAWHYPAPVGPAPTGAAPKAISDEIRQNMTEALEKAIADGAPGAEVEPQVGYGHPAQVLVEESKNASLLVVGNRGHGAFTGMLVGSVSIHCVTNAHCPVVVVRGAA